MTTKFHISKSGEPAKCDATYVQCPRGGAESHYASEEDARKAIELSMAHKMDAPKLKKTKKGNSYMRVGDESQSTKKTDTVERYEHPQGKVAIIKNGKLYISKNGRQASSSATISNLRAGRGAWKKSSDTSDVDVSNLKHSDQEYTSENASEALDNNKRASANIAAGYPSNSPYNPNNSDEITEMDPRHGNYSSPAAILPLSERGNPHKLGEMAVGDKLRFWNFKEKDGTETCDSTFEVWKSEGGNNYKAVVTASNRVYGRGSTGYFAHDQTGARMGERWECVGSFRPIEDGGIRGEVPDRSMPIYTYK